MGLFDGIRRALVGEELASLSDQLQRSEANIGLLQDQLLRETISDLELSAEDRQWVRLNRGLMEFDRRQLSEIWAMSRLMYLKNPLINRGVNLQCYYVWGQGINIEARHSLVDERIQAFLDDEGNQTELTSHQARTFKETDLQVYGNLFLVLFADPISGMVRVRSIPCDEIIDIISNPEDRRDVWFYLREWNQTILNMVTGVLMSSTHIAYYPDMRHEPRRGERPQTIGGHPVIWESPICHIKVGGLGDMRFGMPETYQAIDWARAYTRFLEDWATIVRAYARFAWAMRTPGKAGVAAAQSTFGTTLGIGGETNPPPVTGSMFIGAEGYDLQPLRTAGATTSADDSRRLLLMVCAALGIPETFTGDVSVGTLATARSLDRPTELKFIDRQRLWADVLNDLLQYVVDKAMVALTDPLPEDDPETGDPIDRHINISFPPILEHDPEMAVRAIVSAATLDGKPSAGTIPDAKLLTRMLLVALGEQDIDEKVAQLYPDDSETVEAVSLAKAIGELREAVAKWIIP